jgi:hypothetical protein
MFVVYLTIYKGSILPTFYIGSTKLETAMSGEYFGSVKSKKWKEKFENEMKTNKHLFSLTILSQHETREAAFEAELKEQKERNAVKSTEYFNESFASVNGFFGRDISGENHHLYGKKGHSSNTGRELSEEHKLKIGIAHKGTKRTDETKIKMSISHTGIKHTEETKRLLSKMKMGKPSWNSGLTVSKNCKCEACGKLIAGNGNLKRHIAAFHQIIT